MFYKLQNFKDKGYILVSKLKRDDAIKTLKTVLDYFPKFDLRNGDESSYRREFECFFHKLEKGKHPIKYTITNITKAAIPIVGYAAFVIYSHNFFHLCGSSCSSSSYVAFCIYGILAITSFKYSLGFTSSALQVASSEHTTLILTAAS